MDDAINLDRQGLIGDVLVNIGRFSYGLSGVQILNYDFKNAKLEIGSFCSLGKDLKILMAGEHPTEYISTYPFGHPKFINEIGGEPSSWQSLSKGNVIIGHDVWIGIGVTILSGVSIGSGSVVAANSTIVKNVEPYSIVGGCPAKKIRSRFEPNIIKLLIKLEWWTLKIEEIKEISYLLSKTIPSEEIISNLIKKYRSVD